MNMIVNEIFFKIIGLADLDSKVLAAFGQGNHKKSTTRLHF